METTDFQHNSLPLAKIGVAAGAAVLAGVALTGCQDGVSKVEYQLETTGVVGGTLDGGQIDAGTNIRNYPRVDIDTDNKCGTAKDAIKIPKDIKVDMVSPESDGNGPWYGFNVKSLSNLPKKCYDDETGVIWVASKYVPSNFTESNVTLGKS